jgi:hypothetical protein
MEPAYIVARCGAHGKRPFLIRFRHREAGWVYENATAIEERKVGGGDAVSLEGRFQGGASYPGCPYCKAHGFFLCNACSKLNCWDGRQTHVICAWCQSSASIHGEIDKISGRSG